jgi:hypothetical protein
VGLDPVAAHVAVVRVSLDFRVKVGRHVEPDASVHAADVQILLREHSGGHDLDGAVRRRDLTTAARLDPALALFGEGVHLGGDVAQVEVAVRRACDQRAPERQLDVQVHVGVAVEHVLEAGNGIARAVTTGARGADAQPIAVIVHAHLHLFGIVAQPVPACVHAQLERHGRDDDDVAVQPADFDQAAGPHLTPPVEIGRPLRRVRERRTGEQRGQQQRESPMGRARHGRSQGQGMCHGDVSRETRVTGTNRDARADE